MHLYAEIVRLDKQNAELTTLPIIDQIRAKLYRWGFSPELQTDEECIAIYNGICES